MITFAKIPTNAATSVRRKFVKTGAITTIQNVAILKILCLTRPNGIIMLIFQKIASGEVQAIVSGRVSRLEVVGNVGKKKTNLVQFRIAYDFVVSKRSGNKIKQFITCRCFGRLADYAQHLTNDIVFVTGKLCKDTFHEVKTPREQYYIMATTLFVQPLVFESPETYRKRVRARRQGYVVEEDAEGEDYLSRQNIKDDMATPNIQDEDLPF